MSGAVLIFTMCYAALVSVVLCYIIVDWTRANAAATRYRSGYDAVHKAFEGLKDRLKKKPRCRYPWIITTCFPTSVAPSSD